MVLNSLSDDEEHSLAWSEQTFTFLGEMTSSNEADSAIMLLIYQYPCFHPQSFSYNVSMIKSHSLRLLIYITISKEKQWGSTLINLNEITLLITSSILGKNENNWFWVFISCTAFFYEFFLNKQMSLPQISIKIMQYGVQQLNDKMFHALI